MEKRELSHQLDISFTRYRELMEIVPDVVYELDSAGRFLSINQNVFSLLGYNPQELIGAHFSTLIPQTHEGLAIWRMNERRTGSRSTRRLQLPLAAKSAHGTQSAIVQVELAATGLYDKRRFVGTIGVIRKTGGVHGEASALPLPVAELPRPQASIASPEPGDRLRPPRLPQAGERRCAPRVALTGRARFSLGPWKWEGTSMDISLGGVRLGFDETVPAAERQPVQIVIHFDSSVLELPGVVSRVRIGGTSGPIASSVGSAFECIVAFSQLGATEGAVLAQLLQEIPRQTLSIELAGSLSLPQDMGEQEVSKGTESPTTPYSEPEGRRPAEGRAVWKNYLAYSACLANFPDYWQTLAQIFRLAGARRGGERILDAGCGSGLAGTFLLMDEAYRVRSAPRDLAKPLHYVGIDFVSEALLRASHNLSRMAAELSAQSTGVAWPESLVKLSFGVADLNRELPFRESSFDRIVCHFVINYLESPESSLRELVRLLRPGGTLVVTTLKPLADLSEIQRNLFPIADQPDMVKQAMKLLSLWSRIEQGATPARVRPIDEHELTALLRASGAQCPRIYRVFANQAVLALTAKA
ncbi:MAG: methyltransferase domain-containing protein [Nitrospirota bacterium]